MRNLLTVQHDDPTPVYEQVRRQLRAHIESGTLTAGARLLPVRQLAEELGLAPGTVARAYKELEADGLIITRRGAGTTVAPGRAGAAAAPAHLADAAAAYRDRAVSLGFSLDEAVSTLRAQWGRQR